MLRHILNKGVVLLPSTTVDDGSGIVHCNSWYNQNATFAGSSAGALNSIPTALRRVTPESSVGFVSTPMQLLEMGNLVRVRGRITQFRDRREIAVDTICQSQRLA